MTIDCVIYLTLLMKDLMKNAICLTTLVLLTGCVVVPYDQTMPRHEPRYENSRPVVVYPAPRVITPPPVYRTYPPDNVIVPVYPPRVIVVPAPEKHRDRDWDRHHGRDGDKVERPQPPRPAPPVLSPDLKDGPRMKILPIKPGEEKEKDVR